MRNSALDIPAAVHRPANSRAGYLSFGAWLILAMALASSIAVLTIKPPARKDLEMWAFARTHVQMYEPLLAQWNKEQPRTVEVHLLSNDVLTRRMQSGFLSNTPIADIIEVERSMIGPVFSGPLEDVGFVDLTDRLKAEGLLEQINAPSFSPWTSRGRIFGLPHDVHPTLLAYRADIVEAEGIDVSKIETWDDFTRIMKPLVKDLNGDGSPDRYVLSLWYTSQDQIEALLLQAGGGFFNEKNELILNSDTNAEVIAQVIAWTCGPNRIAADAPEFSASGNQLKLQGYVLAAVMPDWLAATWKSDLPQLAGKLKLMPLPAWKKGGRRTSVWGGTMLGIPKSSKHFDEAWNFAKHLYLSPELAKQLWKQVNILSPNKKNWSQPYYHDPDPYFCNQVTGELLIEQAPNVPLRPSSPYHNLAKARMMDAVVAVRQFAVANQQYDPVALKAEAKRQLALSEEQVRKQIERNVFLKEAP